MHDIRYSAPTTVADALTLLADPDTRVLAGGTDLLIQMRAGSRDAAHLVDVKRITELAELRCTDGDGLNLGAAVPCHRVSADPDVRRLYPGLAEATELIGSTQIQSRATIAGNLCNSSPAADTTPALIAIGARAVIAGASGTREVDVAAFVTAPGQNVLADGEFVTRIVAPPPGASTSDAYLRLTPRNEMDIAIVGAGAQIRMDGDTCVAARVGLGAVAPTPLLADAVADAVVGKSLDEAVLAGAADAARALASPISDMRGPAEYRKSVIGVLTRRAIATAAARARA